MTRFSVQIVFLIALIVLGTGIYLRQLLPDMKSVRPELLAEPLQTSTAKKPFKVTVKQIEYTVKPQADYEIFGVVVSRHDTHTWWDYLHREFNDHLNVADLCVVWGKNLRSNNYKELSYSSGQFTCNVLTKSDAVWSNFDPDSLSNNHVLTDSPTLAKKLKGFKVGDQIRIKGVLAEYGHKTGTPFTRGTSLVRTDRGNGACETLFVTDVTLLKATSHWPASLRFLGWALLAFAIFAWFVLTKEIED
jgi:hypothetical protein